MKSETFAGDVRTWCATRKRPWMRLCAGLNVWSLGAVFLLVHSCACAAVSEGVTLELRQPDGRYSFHMGEPIDIEEIYTSQTSGFVLVDNPIDRYPFWAGDAVHVEPASDAIDPLADYFRARPPSTIDGMGPHYVPLTKGKPVTLPMHLDDWIRFKKPGTYQVWVSSGRIRPASGTGGAPEPEPEPEPFSVFSEIEKQVLLAVSNKITICILPADHEWTNKAFAEAIAETKTADWKKRQEGVRALRCLDTPDSVLALLQMYESPDAYTLMNSEVRDALYGSSHRELLIHTMLWDIGRPDAAITRDFTDDLALLQRLKLGFDAVPPGAEKRFRDEDQRRLEQAIDSKEGFAKAECAYTLFSLDMSNGSPDVEALRQKTSKDGRRLAQVFADLDPGSQIDLLTYDVTWKYLRCPEITAPLLQVWKAPGGANAYARQLLRTAVLKRLSEIAPDAARSIILEQLQKPQPEANAEALTTLPDASSHALDQAFVRDMNAKNEGADMFTIAPLIDRYATAAILPEAKLYYASGARKWACVIEDGFLGYFLRVDPAFGIQQVNALLSPPHITGCYRFVLSDLAKQHPTMAALRELIGSHVNDADPEIARDAAPALKLMQPKSQ